MRLRRQPARLAYRGKGAYLPLLRGPPESNIPSSAIPHAWAHDHAGAVVTARPDTTRGPSLAALAGIGALVYLVYRAVR